MKVRAGIKAGLVRLKPEEIVYKPGTNEGTKG
jgi:hypothetical protein